MYLETIKIVDGEAQYLHFHQQRAHATLSPDNALELKQIVVNAPQKGIYRCRIRYSETSCHVEFIPYTQNVPKQFHIVYAPELTYEHKYFDRSAINALKSDFEEIIIVKNDLLTDTSIANIALYDGTHWITPRTPLLKGTTRERLLREGMIQMKDITVTELHDYEKMALLNAMVGFKEVEDAIILSNNTMEKRFHAARGRSK